MNEQQKIRAEALEQATRLGIAVARAGNRAATAASILKLADKFSGYISTGDHR